MSDFRDTWRVLCHGGGDKTEGTETIGMAFSTCADKPLLPPLVAALTIELVGTGWCGAVQGSVALDGGPGPGGDVDDALR